MRANISCISRESWDSSTGTSGGGSRSGKRKQIAQPLGAQKLPDSNASPNAFFMCAMTKRSKELGEGTGRHPYDQSDLLFA